MAHRAPRLPETSASGGCGLRKGCWGRVSLRAWGADGHRAFALSGKRLGPPSHSLQGCAELFNPFSRVVLEVFGRWQLTRPVARPVQSAPCPLLIHHALWPLVHDGDALSAPSHPFCTVRDFLTSLSSFSP